ncbi:MAG: F0F1 ATP synthase subunit B [Pirellulaceae bacterium]|nr:F0F1 ATP synthase subunit B [Pirellulaceae bacterium]
MADESATSSPSAAPNTADVGNADAAQPSSAVANKQSHAGDHGHSGDHGHGSGQAAGHDDHDPTHVNMTDQAEDPSEWRSEMAIASLIVFGCLLAVLSAFAWKPISEGLDRREKSIANHLANAEKASQDAMAKLREYEAKLSLASSEAQQMLSDARKDAEATGQRLISSAQEEAARHRERAVAEIESAKTIALGELAQRSTDIAMSLAGRIIGREVKAADHQSLIQEMLSKLPSKN